MKIKTNTPPREFNVGKGGAITMKDCAHIRLEANEQVSFFTPEGRMTDFAAKDWGFYATPSMNGNLVRQGFKTALVQNPMGQVYIMIVETGKEAEFNAYLKAEDQTVLEWLNERPAKK